MGAGRRRSVLLIQKVFNGRCGYGMRSVPSDFPLLQGCDRDRQARSCEDTSSFGLTETLPGSPSLEFLDGRRQA